MAMGWTKIATEVVEEFSYYKFAEKIIKLQKYYQKLTKKSLSGH
jgi:hypothetical protein